MSPGTLGRWTVGGSSASASSVVSACAFGSGALFAKPVYALGVDWLTLLSWRFLIGAALAWLALAIRPDARRALRALRRREVLVALGLGVWYVMNSGTYYASLETVPASLAGLLVYTYPAIVAVLALRLGRPLEGRRAWGALALALAGVVLAVGGIDPSAVPPVAGLVLAMASPVIYAVWIILSARLSGERTGTCGRRQRCGRGGDGRDAADDDRDGDRDCGLRRWRSAGRSCPDRSRPRRGRGSSASG